MPEKTQRSFTGGEIAPALRSRADIAKYTNGLALCENMFVRAQGGVYSRQGLRYTAELGDSSKRGRLIPFSFNTEQTYMLVFEENTLRFVRDAGDSGNAGYVLENDGVTIYEIATPYLESELSRLIYTQRADVMTITHPNHEPRNLSRTADNVWSLDIIDYSPDIEPPTFPATTTTNISNITQTNPAVVTTVSPHLLMSGDVISITGVAGMTEVNDLPYTITVLTATTFELDDTDASAYTAYTSGGTVDVTPIVAFGGGEGDFNKTYNYVVTAVDINGEESIASAEVSLTTKSLSSTRGIRIQWEPVEGASFYNVYKDPSNATGIYGFIGRSNSLSFDDFNIAPITSEAPPTLRDPFTDITGNITGLSGFRFTSADHGLLSGETVTINNILQPTDFNGLSFTVQVINDDEFEIITDLTGPFDPYTSGGTFLRAGQKPATVSYYQQRQVYANSDTQRQTVFMSQTANFDNFRTSTPTRASDAITFSIAGTQVNEVRHIVEIENMILLTSGGVWRVTEGQDRVITPATVGVRNQSGKKGSSWVPPIKVGETVLYVQNLGSRIRDLRYQTIDVYSSADLSIMSQHLFEDYTVEEMTYSDEPFGILWAVRDDGRLLGMTYQEEQQVWGWHQHVTDGEFESCATIEEDRRDATYVIVKRTINNQTRRYIERFEKRDVSTVEDVFCVDSGLNYDGTAATVISGLDHLEGESVAVLADGNEVTGLTVSSGAITLPRAASKVVVGLPYTPKIQTLDIDTGEVATTLKAREVNIARVTIEVESSRSLFVAPVLDDGTEGEFREVKPRQDSDGYGAIPLRTYKAEVTAEPNWSKGGGLVLKGSSPLPLAILSVVPEFDISR